MSNTIYHDSKYWFDFVDQDKWDTNGQRWIEELLSGKRKQTDSILMSAYQDSIKKAEFCCLGVGCFLARIPRVSDGKTFKFGHIEGNEMIGSEVLAPPEFAVWLGFDPTSVPNKWESTSVSVFLNNPRDVKKGVADAQGTLLNLDKYHDVAALNDDGVDFKEIGRLIDRYAVRIRWT